MSETVTLVDVTLRDGLQDETVIVPTQTKAAIAHAIAEAGIDRLEVTSFVNPKRVPQMADAADLLQALPSGIRPSALVFNRRGLDRATDAFDAAGYVRDGYDLVFVISASPRHSRDNANCTIDEALDGFDEVAAAAREAEVAVVGSISCALGTPWDEETITPEAIAGIADRLAGGGARDLTLCDTVGRARAEDVAEKVRRVAARTGHVPGLHLHDLGADLSAVLDAGLSEGVRRFDAALNGLGGCPFAPNAPGNVNLRTLAEALSARGYRPQVCLPDLSAAETLLAGAVWS